MNFELITVIHKICNFLQMLDDKKFLIFVDLFLLKDMCISGIFGIIALFMFNLR